MLIFVSGHHPIYGTQMLYFFDPILRSRAEIPPPTRFYSIHDGGLSPQDPLPDLAPRPKPTPAPHSRRRPSFSSGSGPDAATLFEQPPPPAVATLQPPEGLVDGWISIRSDKPCRRTAFNSPVISQQNPHCVICPPPCPLPMPGLDKPTVSAATTSLRTYQLVQPCLLRGFSDSRDGT